jgi:hypothetical protein
MLSLSEQDPLFSHENVLFSRYAPDIDLAGYPANSIAEAGYAAGYMVGPDTVPDIRPDFISSAGYMA